jgi:hypothetical protein
MDANKALAMYTVSGGTGAYLWMESATTIMAFVTAFIALVGALFTAYSQIRKALMIRKEFKEKQQNRI